MSQPIHVFISYAHKDEAFKDELMIHLKPLERGGIIDVWQDREIDAGDTWNAEIQEALLKARVILFLVSSDFMASDFIHREEMKRAIEKHKQDKVSIVPVWIRPSANSYSELDQFQSLPKDRKPVSKWDDRDEAWVNVVQALRRLFDKLNNPNPSTTPVNTDPAPNVSPIVQNTAPSLDKSKIRDMIVKGKLKDALQTVLDYAENNNLDTSNELTLLLGRLNDLERQERLGLQSYSELQIGRNNVVNALLGILGEL
ncbi:MAG: toll/interleukin-1 receptor domain-containing protein [Saprospiraceae bacterium]|nr:toll/interleukin-1 receptor domain-containing protein [Saprospiraceae bacterium]